MPRHTAIIIIVNSILTSVQRHRVEAVTTRYSFVTWYKDIYHSQQYNEWRHIIISYLRTPQFGLAVSQFTF